MTTSYSWPSGTERFERVSAADRIIDVLGHPYRRRILMRLAASDPGRGTTISIDAGRDRADDLDWYGMQLYHNHLPKLTDAGFVRWNRETQQITVGPAFESVRPLLSLLVDHPRTLPDGWL